MGRPKKSLFQRCREQSFRVRHHWHLLLSEPDLPCPSLAELQRRAREAETEDAVKEVARVFRRTLDSLPPEELQLLLSTQPPGAADDRGEQEPPAPTSARRGCTQAPLAAVEAALAQLPLRLGTQLSPTEQIQAELIERVAERLAEVDERLSAEGLTVAGSQGQPRQHPLLALEAGLRRELMQSLQQLEFRVENRARLERLNALTRARAGPPRPRRRAAGPKRHGSAGLRDQPPDAAA
jgi:hypothetical protein